MAKQKASRRQVRTTAVRKSTGGRRRPASRRRPAAADPLLAAIPGTEHREVAGVSVDMARAGAARVRRVVYPAGFRWSRHMKPEVGTDLCLHAHVGFLARGRIRIDYADGCVARFTAPRIVVIEPGHDGRVVGGEAAVLIEFDFERETIDRLGLPAAHRHE